MPTTYLVLHRPTGAKRWLLQGSSPADTLALARLWPVPDDVTLTCRWPSTIVDGEIRTARDGAYPVRPDPDALAAFLSRLDAYREAYEGPGEAGCSEVARALGYVVRDTVRAMGRVWVSASTGLPRSMDRCWIDRPGTEFALVSEGPLPVSDDQMARRGAHSMFGTRTA